MAGPPGAPQRQRPAARARAVPTAHTRRVTAPALLASRPCSSHLPPPHTRHSTGFQHRRANYRPGRNIPPSTERRRTAQRDEVSNPRLRPLSGSPLFPHMPCVESTNHIRTSPSRLMMCTAARPSPLTVLRSCGAARRMPLACLYASAGRLGQPPPPAASATASRLLPGAQHGAFCLALSTAPSAWLELRPLPRARHGAQQSRRKR